MPHSSLFTNINCLKKIGSFPENLGTAADFYVTATVIRDKDCRVHLERQALTKFSIGGVSSKIKSIIDYRKALKKLEINRFYQCYLIGRKFLSYLKYRL